MNILTYALRTTSICALTLAATYVLAQPPSTLPVKQVTLFTSGVSYTERAGAVDGDAAVPLTFRTAQINDILKSMILIDSAGKVQPATYGSRDPIGRSLQAFAVDVQQNASREAVLRSLRGARVTVSAAGKSETSGQIVGVETRQITGADQKTTMIPYLNLLTDSGLMVIPLTPDNTVKLDDERLNREFHEALALLATGTDDQRRSVLLHFAGNGRRDVRVGYVTESPIWKISYRLLIGGESAAKPYLQGWALVENTTDEDWSNVNLSLVSGRPISFIQDLYQPLYVPRPVVAPDIVASPYPQTHDENMEQAKALGAFALGAKGGFGGGGAQGPEGPRGDMGPAGPGGVAGGMAAPGSGGGGRSPGLGELAKQSVAAMSNGEKAGELFQYHIATPVSLPRQQAAMIPVIAQDVETEKVSLYNADVSARYAMNAIRLHNTTALHLKGGPVTLFDGGVYAGDARMEDVPPGDSRLITYAVDLSLACERQGPTSVTEDTTVSIKEGVMTLNRREEDETTYTLKSKADKPRTVLVEHPFSDQYQLISPAKADERTATLYRFAITVKPGDSQTLKVKVERPLSQQVAVLDGDINLISYTSSRKDVSPALKAALQGVIQRRRHVDELKAQADARTADITAIGTDQDRIRKNMEALDRASALYKRYVSELDMQETKIDALRAEVTKLQADAEAAAAELRTYVNGIEVAGS